MTGLHNRQEHVKTGERLKQTKKKTHILGTLYSWSGRYDDLKNKKMIKLNSYATELVCTLLDDTKTPEAADPHNRRVGVRIYFCHNPCSPTCHKAYQDGSQTRCFMGKVVVVQKDGSWTGCFTRQIVVVKIPQVVWNIITLLADVDLTQEELLTLIEKEPKTMMQWLTVRKLLNAPLAVENIKS